MQIYVFIYDQQASWYNWIQEKMKFQAQERWDLIIKIHVEMLLSHLIFLTTLSLLGSQGGYTTGKGRIHPWMSCQFILLTVFLQLSKAVITHTCWLVLQVLQVVLVGRAGLTHHLSKTFYSSQGKRTSINGGMVEPMLWEGLRPCHRRGSDASSRWGWTRRYRSCTWWPSGLGSR